MNKCFTDEGWRDYIYWQREDKKTLKRINDLLKDIERNEVSDGIGTPEKLIADFSGFWSRRIDQKNRLIYKIKGNNIIVISCRYHYNDK